MIINDPVAENGYAILEDEPDVDPADWLETYVDLARAMARVSRKSHFVITSPLMDEPAVVCETELQQLSDGSPALTIHFTADHDGAAEAELDDLADQFSNAYYDTATTDPR